MLLPVLEGRHSSKAGRAVGLPLRLTGTGLTVWAARSLGRNLTPLPEPLPHATLVEAGAYRFARHPIYGGLLLMALGWSADRSSRRALLLTGALGALFEAKAQREERRISARFPAYGAYQKRVQKFLPGVY
ncbi:isoprenylcysteine carboxylmethyltransferase family protein (plasmid) [Deinococcus taeanensis]|uniref:methyltransferase family protein n=1 Tax=Deinococcus taeanensis TaxID=2737050 RepID=UPI001CDC7225|nr:isoprenylcysteine carboxylmethyltransferase family protein [Deinococcus taeanensis]UBV44145.1 isoprenylcysteine carboxylmethyltransferase family protein [Deinococcus taeanensis]